MIDLFDLFIHTSIVKNEFPFDFTSTGKLVLPTYPLRKELAEALLKEITEGRLSVSQRHDDTTRQLLEEQN